MSLVLLFHYLMLNMFRMLIHPSSGTCDLIVIPCVVLLWYDVCWCHGVVRLGWCGILMQAEALVHPDTTPSQPNHNVTPTLIEPEQHNP